ncbi:Oxysterol-binding protein [Gonapodya prolifera JEL478]|uniref:Oxysterol-binding protein n=1 Tax=Gonapodya prolifera (strain JEL478) TaxID=1344416 RepID=A0A139AMT3_GONPJ|nr:Oxysterol-binding protein [Gonapodya prolifera JEL478]|eukprot:KXS17775.1 Oxysterol-binding protein [Gonapodya prolifera JEL478]
MEEDDEDEAEDTEQEVLPDTADQFDELDNASESSSRGELLHTSNAPSVATVDKFRAATLAVVATQHSVKDEGVTIVRRTKLPSKGAPDSPISMISILRRNVGKDLSTVSMPVALNVPLSLLQGLAEEMEYAPLLEKAANASDPITRILYVASFAVSGYASTLLRAGRKPFNPLLGETYELVRQDKGFRFISEKVSHQPPILAYYCESLKPNSYAVFHESQGKSRFWGKSLEIVPTGSAVHVHLRSHNEIYTFHKVSTFMKNIIAGTKYLEHVGELTVTNHTTGHRCILSFREAGWLSGKNEIFGTVLDDSGTEVGKMSGRWDDGVCRNDLENPDKLEILWKATPWPSNTQEQFGFTSFAINVTFNSCTEITADIAAELPPTDSRKRPDQRLYENGDIESAEAEKARLEQAQRERRKLSPNHKPRWFEKREDPYREGGDGMTWQYNGRYWDRPWKSGLGTEGMEIFA